MGAVQPQIRDIDNLPIVLSEGNSIDRLGFILVNRRGERMKSKNPPHPVFALTAACMLFRRSAYEIAGGFDGDYFLSYDEIDLCWRTWLAGFSIYCVPSAVIWHKPSTTVNAFFRFQLSYFDCRNRLTSMVKNYSYPLLAKYLIPSILASLFDVTRKLLHNDWRAAIGTVRALGEIIASLNETLRKRRFVQRTRRIPDSYLLHNGLIVPMNFTRLYPRSTGFD
jgi:GT2 family glycosyltransferase